MNRVSRINEKIIGDEEWDFRSRRGYEDNNFSLKQLGGKTKWTKYIVYVVFIYLEKVFDRVNREARGQELRMHVWPTSKMSGHLILGVCMFVV